MEPKVFPKCGKPGSLQTKWVKNGKGVRYTYGYFAHYGGRGGNLTKVVWHYVGKKRSKGSRPYQMPQSAEVRRGMQPSP